MLVMADLVNREWWVFDSCCDYEVGIDETVIDDWEMLLKDHWRYIHEEKGDVVPEFPNFFRPQVHLREQCTVVPQQRSGTHNCGPFVCMYGRVLMEQLASEEADTNSAVEKFMSCEEVSAFRKLMFLELSENSLCSARKIKI